MTKKSIAILPTNACNFDCKYCGTIKSHKINFISFKTVKRVLEEAIKNGVRSLFITGGGEPLIDFEKTIEIIKLAKKMGFKVILNTNGYFIANPNPRDAIRNLKDVDTINFSVDHDHLKFIPYSQLLKAIKTSLYSNIKVRIKIINRSETKCKNLLLLKKLSKDLDGKLINLTPLTGIEYKYSAYLIFAKKMIRVMIYDAQRTNVNNSLKSFKPMILKDILFKSCSYKCPAIDSNSNIFSCCAFDALNHSKLYSFGKVGKKNIFNNFSNPLLSSIQLDSFPFLKIFLRIRKNKKLFNTFLKQKYYSCCDFCLQILKHRKEIERIKIPSKLEMIVFFILNPHHLLFNTYTYLVDSFNYLTYTYLVDIFNYLIFIISSFYQTIQKKIHHP